MPPKIEGKLTPEVIQVTLLDEIASRVADLQSTMESLELRVLDVHETQKAKITAGILEGAEIDVTDQLKSVLRVSGYKHKWYELTIFNDGADGVYVSSEESKHKKPLLIKMGDHAKASAKTGSRRDLYVWCNNGESATIRVGFER